MTEPIPAAESYIGWRLSELASNNEHHKFEEIAIRIARKRISSNLLVANGPVSAGGDQGRDGESYTTRIPDELPHSAGFSASASTAPVVVACTLQRGSLKQKVLDDMASICRADGAKVDFIVFFSVQSIPEATTHELQKAAREDYGVTLEVFSGSKLATLLAEPDLIWVARHYLELPSEMVPDTGGEMAPGWYSELLEHLRENHGPAAITYAAQGEVILGLRHATWDKATNAELPEWLDFMGAFLTDTEADEHGGGDSELVFRACHEMTIARFRGQGIAAGTEDLIRRAIDYACSTERADIIDDAVTLVSYWGGMWGSGAGRATAAEISQAVERLRTHLVAELEATDPTTHPMRTAMLTGTLASVHLLPKWDRAEAAGRTPEPVEVAGHVGVQFEEMDMDTSALADSDLFEFDEAMTYLDKLVDLLPAARSYSAKRPAGMFSLFAPALADHPLYGRIRDGLDAAVAEVDGDAAIAARCRDRAVALLKSGKPLEALDEMHTAKLRWFHGDTIYGTVLAMRFIGNIYHDFGLTYAAKMYACTAAAMALLHPDTEVKTHVPKALLEAVTTVQSSGCWADAAALTEVALLAQYQFAADPWDYDKHPQVATLEANSLLELGPVRKFWPDLEVLFKEAMPETGWYERLDELLNDPENQVPLTEDEFQALAREQFAGPVLCDVGRQRVVEFSALGVRWVFTFDNDKATVLTAESYIASFQVLVADVARFDPVFVRTTVETSIEVVDGAPRSVDSVDIDNHEPVAKAKVVLSNDTDDFEAITINRIAATFPLLDAVDVRPSTELEPLLDALVRDGLPSKVTVGRPYEDAANLIPTEHYERCAAATQPASSDAFKVVDNEHLAASTKDGPTYDRDLSLTRIRERYAGAEGPWHLTIARLLADERGRAAVTRLREAGWLDWQILMAVANVGVNWRMEAAGIDPRDTTIEKVRPLMDEVETEDGPQLPIERVLEELDLHMHMQVVTVGQGWKVYGRNEERGEDALRDLLERRYHYAEDDVPHRDLLNCLAEDGTLLPILEPQPQGD